MLKERDRQFMRISLKDIEAKNNRKNRGIENTNDNNSIIGKKEDR